MITAIVNFKLPAGIDAKQAAELFEASAPKYRGVKGLVRKYYLFDEESRIGGGVYLWKSRIDAEAVYTPQVTRVNRTTVGSGLYRGALRRAARDPLFRDGGDRRQ